MLLEEEDLLSTPAKLLVLVLTALYHALHRFPLEIALGLALLLVLLVPLLLLLLTARKRTSTRSRFALLAATAACVVLLPTALDWLDSALYARGSSFSSTDEDNNDNDTPLPPTLPLLREQLVLSNADGFFREASAPGRIALLRGVNFGAKTPNGFANTATIPLSKFYDANTPVSFQDRPCALKDCGAHFRRLRRWGFTVLRLLVSWEAIEPHQPDEYDTGYLAFVKQLCQLAGKHGLSVIIDPHQDVWSRFTGGDGAPAWTLRAAGFALPHLHETNAAVLHAEAVHRNESYPTMIWPTNYGKLACATMFTLFFAGNEYAPRTRVGEEQEHSIQDFLQDHYVRAIQQVARTLREERNVLGFDTLNEPSMGYVGLEDVRRTMFPVPLGLHTSALTGMLLGAGFSRRVNRFGPRPMVFEKTTLVNPHGRLAWQSPKHDVWRQNGVWDVDAQGRPQLLRPGHFRLPTGAGGDNTFASRFFVPFLRKFTLAIRSESHDYFIFAEPAINLLEERQRVEQAPSEAFDLLGGRFAWAPHLYDGGTLMTKTFHEWYALDAERGALAMGRSAAHALFVRMGATVRRSGAGWPVLVGETGVPQDMYAASSSALALDRLLSGFERSFLSWTLWNYMPDSSQRQGGAGDGWNGEDLSLWSDGRARRGGVLLAAVRPYPTKLAGEPLETWFDVRHHRFFLKVRLFIGRSGSGEVLETEVFVPRMHFPRSPAWRVGGRGSSIVKHVSADEQLLVWRHDVSPGATSVHANELFVDQWLELEPSK